MDELNAHQFWGISPAVDLLAVASKGAPREGSGPARILQVTPYDSRHTLYTMCRMGRHSQEQVQLFVYEEEAEALARHMLLVSVLLDGTLLAKERMETFLELHCNVLLREKTAKYLEERGRALEQMLVALSSKGELPTAQSSNSSSKSGADAAAGAGASEPMGDNGIGLLASLLDISMLKFQDRDAIVEALQKYRQSVAYDMVKAWDARSRKWYGDRFDFRRNMIDWDYHMPLVQAGTPGQDPLNGSIIHFHHFRHWRTHGIAYELRDSHYSQPNRSVLSTAVGRTKEFKDRNGKDVGRSVSAWGYWGDILNSPYHCFGTVAEEDGFFKVSNKQFCRTAVDVAEHNIMALLHELRTGQRYSTGDGEAHRARVARGPTSMADLQEQSQKQQEVQQKVAEQDKAKSGQEQGAGKEESPQQQPPEGGKAAGSGEQQAAAGEGNSSTGASTLEKVDGQEAKSPHQDAPSPASASEQAAPEQASDSTDSSPAFIPSVTFQGSKPGYAFKRGAQGIGYYADKGAQASASSQASAQASQPQQQASSATSGASEQTAAEPSPAVAAEAAQEGASSGEAGSSQAADSSAGEAQSSALREQMEAEARAIREAEAALDAAAAARLGNGRVKLTFVLGSPGTAGSGTSSLAKLLTGRAKFEGAFEVVTVGHRHIHLLGPDHQLAKATAQGGLVVAENANHMLLLKKDQAAAFCDKVAEVAKTGGFQRAPALEEELCKPLEGKTSGMVLTQAHLVFKKP